mmetsp:Transcript_56/g.164  ORF Transcript_56/g.164 Transcript_56/m.164 type:complete len:113 (+) Transcript_56:151-489(+)
MHKSELQAWMVTAAPSTLYNVLASVRFCRETWRAEVELHILSYGSAGVVAWAPSTVTSLGQTSTASDRGQSTAIRSWPRLRAPVNRTRRRIESIHTRVRANSTIAQRLVQAL